MKFDELLEKIGEFGPYQRRIFVLVSLTAVVAGYQAMSPIFLLAMNDYRCTLPFYANDTYAVQSSHHESLINFTVPMVTDTKGATTYSKCNLYNVTSHVPGDNGNYSQYKCDAWVYDTSVMETSGFTDFNMVCEREILRAHSNMIDFSGALLGAITIGPIADILGRKKTLIMTFLINSVASVAISQSPNFAIFATINFILGLTGRVMFLLAFVLALETVGQSKRTVAGVAFSCFWSAGLFILTGAAYLIRQWRYLRLALGIPPVLIISYWWLIPESCRWLISRGRITEATKIIRKIAKSNGVELDEGILVGLTASDDNEDHTGILKLLMNPIMVLRAVVIFFNWFAVTAVYYGLSLNVGNMSGDIYVNFLFSSLMELIAFLVTLVLLNKVGRKTLQCVSMIVGGLACLATIFPVIYESDQLILMALAMIGKLMTTIAFTVVYIFSAELFPTVVRQSAMGTCALFEGCAGMVAPYIADLGIHVGGQFKDALPLIVLGCLTLAAGCMAVILPETRGRKLPETIEDAFLFGEPVGASPMDHDADVNLYL